MNATATLAPLVVALHLPADPESGPVARGLLGMALAMDALFNAVFGCGVLLVGLGQAGGRRVLAVAAGLLTIPVAGQVVSPAAARWLLVAGPLWLTWLVFASIDLWRSTPTPSRK